MTIETMTANTTGTATGTGTGAVEFRFFGYDAKAQYPAPDGKRLVTCLYRSKGDKPAEKENAGIFVPNWITAETVTNNLPVLIEHIVEWLKGVEDARVKESHKSNSVGFGASYFSLPALLEALEKTSTSRLSGEAIKEWFDSEDVGYKVALLEMYAEKVGAEKATKLVEFIGKKLESLASPKTVWEEKDRTKFLDLLAVLENDPMATRLTTRIKAMEGKEEEDLSDLL